MELIIIAVLILIPIIWYINIYNDIQRLSIKIEEAFANIDVALVKRYQVLTQLFEVAKGYAKHEKETLIAVINVRQGMTLDEKTHTLAALEGEFQRFSVLSESYPELKADKLFLKLQDGIVDSEEHLQAARRMYNSNVSRFNQRIETFPGNMIAKSNNYTRKSMLEFNPEELKNVDLSM